MREREKKTAPLNFFVPARIRKLFNVGLENPNIRAPDILDAEGLSFVDQKMNASIIKEKKISTRKLLFLEQEEKKAENKRTKLI